MLLFILFYLNIRPKTALYWGGGKWRFNLKNMSIYLKNMSPYYKKYVQLLKIYVTLL